MRKFYNFETMFRSLKENLTVFLKTEGIYYELSGCDNGWHFEIKCNDAEVGKVNNWLDENTITEMREEEIMKRKILIAIMAMLVLVVSTSGCYASGKYDGMSWKISKTKGGYITKFYDNGKYNCKVFTKKKLKVKVIKEEKVDYDLLVSRENNFILVEKVKGKCINNKGDGRDSLGYYISYKGVKGHKKGGKYTTYCVYENNTYEDDIIGRIDYKRK